MNRDTVLAILRNHEAELRAAGIERLHLFGSLARGEETESSDIDLAAEMDDSKKWTLFTLGHIQMDLTDWMGTKVDLSLLHWFRPSLRERVLREAIDAF